MKKKNTMPEKDGQQTHEKIRWRELRKRIFVMGLTVAMVANTVDLSALSVSAKTDESETGKTTIVSFEELSRSRSRPCPSVRLRATSSFRPA